MSREFVDRNGERFGCVFVLFSAQIKPRSTRLQPGEKDVAISLLDHVITKPCGP
jgi:hypothetical protein